jgi:hypothetical protein
MDASDWVRLKRLQGARNYQSDKPGDITNPAPRLQPESGRRVYTEFGTSKIRRPASNYTDFIASQTSDFVLESTDSSTGAKILTQTRICDCSTTINFNIQRDVKVCVKCGYDRIVVR